MGDIEDAGRRRWEMVVEVSDIGSPKLVKFNSSHKCLISLAYEMRAKIIDFLVDIWYKGKK
jgi:hypothetical protein